MTPVLVAAIISATVTIMLFGVGQWIAGLQSRHDLLRGKLESACSLVAELRGGVLEMTTFAPPRDTDAQMAIIGAISKSLHLTAANLRTIQMLYFPALSDHVRRILQRLPTTFTVRPQEACATLREDPREVISDASAVEMFQCDCDAFLEYVSLEWLDLTEVPYRKIWKAWRWLV